MTDEWAEVFEGIAETALPVHTGADCTGWVIPVEAVALKEQWPKQLVQHLCPYEYIDISHTAPSDRLASELWIFECTETQMINQNAASGNDVFLPSGWVVVRPIISTRDTQPSNRHTPIKSIPTHSTSYRRLDSIPMRSGLINQPNNTIMATAPLHLVDTLD